MAVRVEDAPAVRRDAQSVVSNPTMDPPEQREQPLPGGRPMFQGVLAIEVGFGAERVDEVPCRVRGEVELVIGG